MSRWAHVVAGVCDLVVDAPAAPDVGFRGGAWVAADADVAPGWAWDGVAWTAPEAAVPAVDRRVTVLAFWQRFTQPERVGLQVAAVINPAGTLAERQAAAGIKDMLDSVMVAKWIDLERADTRSGVQALETAGLLASGRALEILDAPVQPQERP